MQNLKAAKSTFLFVAKVDLITTIPEYLKLNLT